MPPHLDMNSKRCWPYSSTTSMNTNDEQEIKLSDSHIIISRDPIVDDDNDSLLTVSSQKSMPRPPSICEEHSSDDDNVGDDDTEVKNDRRKLRQQIDTVDNYLNNQQIYNL
ncbi:unnamed protein product [Schistosoma curassoni]|uniref:CPXV159 protein n=1 Tax=Schistosoma curassoni TaxID=6186 RepID=A0A183KPZ0_9TREM|nr:unnamed protein product [Schistosoma curassoni]